MISRSSVMPEGVNQLPPLLVLKANFNPQMKDIERIYFAMSLKDVLGNKPGRPFPYADAGSYV